MSKKRIIACLVVRDGIVVQSLGFERYLPVGKPEIAAGFLSDWGVDEIIMLDITASARGELIDLEIVGRVAASVFVPLTVGGGIRGVEDIRRVIQAGADKVAVNSLALNEPEIITEAVHYFGSQCIVCSIDARPAAEGYRVFGSSGTTDTGQAPEELAAKLEAAGAGEILVNAIHRDGMRTGYDFDLIDLVTVAVQIPVIALGGAGHAGHLSEALSREGVAAAAAANYFHFSEHSVAVAKSYLARDGINIRVDSFADYTDVPAFGSLTRPAKRDERELERQIFEYIPEDAI